MAKVTGIGGVFIKFSDPTNMRKWYREVLGINTNDYGVLFAFNDGTASSKGYLQLGTFESSSSYFGNEKQQYMLNFRVDDMSDFIGKLKQHNVNIVDEVETYEYGKFLHIEDPEGNRIELWEPIDSEFDKSESVPMH